MTRDEQDAYFRRALEWIEDRHGKENVLSAVIHRDEATPHMTVMTIPLDDQGENALLFASIQYVLLSIVNSISIRPV